MIAFVKGILYKLEEDSLVIDCGSIGYRIFVPSVTILANVGDEIFLHTYQHVKEDGITLYGFVDEKQLSVFKKCITVSGIGPKIALAVINQLSLNQIISAIQSEDYAIFTQVSGIGKKTAQRMVLELKDKFKQEVQMEQLQYSVGTQTSANLIMQALEGLVGLGFKRNEVEKNVKDLVDEGETNLGNIIKQVLKDKGIGGR